ncbi:MAG TPA: ROK family protein [Bacteroidales bacterium]|nr:ROK family protein [Bacteroidales bacterium]
MNNSIAIGADIGGSHITCAAVNLDSGAILRDTMAERAVDNKAQAATIIKTWSEAVGESISKIKDGKLKGIGFAMPGPFDYVKGISYIKGVDKYENLYGFNITDAISSTLDLNVDVPIRFINDASAFAVGEAWAGSARKYSRSVSITFGTGFGSAFIADKIPVCDGDQAPRLGCIYHIPYKEGIADDYFSTRWFLKQYKAIKGKELSGVKELASLSEVDKVVRDLFHEFGEKAARFLAPWLRNFEAEILVVGGNISHAYNLFGKVFEKTFRDENWNGAVSLSELKEEAALFGSAYLFNEVFWKDVQHALPLM